MPHAPIDPTSTWWDRADGSEAAPPLHGTTTSDVVVIGGGVVGVTVATDLAESGQDVVLLEAGRVGGGATGHSSAKVTALQSPRYARLEADHGHDAARLYGRMSMDAVDRIRHDAARADGEHSTPATALTWTHREDEVATIEAEGEAARRAGLPVRTVTAHERFALRRGLALDDQLQIDPLAHLRALLGRGLAAGLRLHESSPVTGVSMTGDVRTVTTALGTVRAFHVVVATGLPVLDRGAWFARAEPRTSYVVVLRGGEAPDEMGLRVGGSERSSRAIPGVDGEPLVLVAGAGHRVGRGGDTRRHPADLAAWGGLTFHAHDEVARWSAQDWSSADGLPLAGPLVPGDDRVLAAAGFSKWGLTSGTAAAGTLCRRIRGEHPTDVDRLLDPARLPGLGGARKLVSTNATVGWTMAAGWLRAMRPLSGRPSADDGDVGRDGWRPVARTISNGHEQRCTAVCTHLGGVVSWDPEGETWACPLHGSRFATDGRLLSGPATRPLRNA